MVVDSCNIEFGYELISVLPYAYALHKKGILSGSKSGIDTKCLYYFSQNHKENTSRRSFYNNKNCKNIANINIHRPDLDLKEWCPPPLKEKYFTKHENTVIICNRHNVEWKTKPINFFSINDLRKIFRLLYGKYEIIYINFEGLKEYYDNAELIPLNEFDVIRNEFPDVKIFQDIQKESGYSVNEFQLRLFANCSKFITMNGGHSILASYFGGENIIYSKYGDVQCKELYPQINSFYRWYHLFGKSRIDHVESIDKLLFTIKNRWVENNPVINILIRTSNRSNEFYECIKSIECQTYKNIRVLISYDNDKANTYIQPLKHQQIRVHKKDVQRREVNKFYGNPFFPNNYLNELQSYVTEGYIMYLDDDDVLTDNNVVKKIVNEIESGADVVYWKVKVGQIVVPKNEKEIKPCDISGIGICFYHNLKQTWEPYRLGDYRIISKIFEKSFRNHFIPEILTKTQKGLGFGYIKQQIKYQGNGLIETTNEMRKKVKIYLTKDSVLGKKNDSIEVPKTVADELVRKNLATMKIKIVKDVIPELKKDEIIEVDDRLGQFYVNKGVAVSANEIVKEIEKETEVEKEVKQEVITKEYKRKRKTKKEIE